MHCCHNGATACGERSKRASGCQTKNGVPGRNAIITNGVPNQASSAPAHGTSGTGKPAAVQRAQQGRLAKHIGVARAPHAGRRQLEHQPRQLARASALDDAKAEGQTRVPGLHHLQAVDRGRRAVVRRHEAVEMGGDLFELHGAERSWNAAPADCCG